jgi:hypothetical protein
MVHKAKGSLLLRPAVAASPRRNARSFRRRSKVERGAFEAGGAKGGEEGRAFGDAVKAAREMKEGRRGLRWEEEKRQRVVVAVLRIGTSGGSKSLFWARELSCEVYDAAAAVGASWYESRPCGPARPQTALIASRASQPKLVVAFAKVAKSTISDDVTTHR